MAKISERKPKNISGGYERIFGISELGMLMSKVQSAVIASGNELEKIIQSKCRTLETFGTLKDFLEIDPMPSGVFLATKSEVNRCKYLDVNGKGPDFIIFKDQHCHIVELKDGHVFDTKKVFGERETLLSFIERNQYKLHYPISMYFCAFNQKDRDVVWNGFKRSIAYEEAMTGRELCNLLEIDYDEIVGQRLSDTGDNTEYFIQELLKIPEVKSIIKNILQI